MQLVFWEKCKSEGDKVCWGMEIVILKREKSTALFFSSLSYSEQHRITPRFISPLKSRDIH